VNQDARDERIAEALAVPPLDDVTRRRLVRAALDAVPAKADEADEAQPSRERLSWVPLVAAAVVILLVVVGVLALGGGGDDSTDTAARKNGASATSSVDAPLGSADAVAPAAGPGASSGTVSVADLGDLGDLSSSAARRQARTAIAGSTTGYAAGIDRVQELLGEVAGAPCAGTLRSAEIVGVGSATVDGHPAVVAVTSSGATSTPYLLVIRPCALHPL
jgi:hypothetical protein